jgi:hypothetical protein
MTLAGAAARQFPMRQALPPSGCSAFCILINIGILKNERRRLIFQDFDRHFLRACSMSLREGCGMWIGMGCETRDAAMAVAIARTSNEADRPSPRAHPRGDIEHALIA